MAIGTVIAWTAPAAVPPSLGAVLSAEEQATAARRAAPRARDEFVAARILLRFLLAAAAGRPADAWRIERTGLGAPVVTGATGLYVSLSHTAGLVAAGVSDVAPIGVDVETLAGYCDPLAIARRFLHARERVVIEGCGPEERRTVFLGLWSAKEAAAKALGLGLQADFRSFHIQNPTAVPTAHAVIGLSGVSAVRTLIPVPGFVAAVAHADPAVSDPTRTATQDLPETAVVEARSLWP